MFRPPVSRFFDSTIRIWRPTEVKDDVGTEERTYTPIAEVGAAVNRGRTAEREVGKQLTPGLVPRGSIRWYGLASIDIKPRDVCEVIAGPDLGNRWEVDAQPVRPRGHHVQVDCIDWDGVLPEIPS